MKTTIWQQASLVHSIAIVSFLMISSPLIAQNAKPVAHPIGSKHIPDNAIALLTFSPAELMSDENLELFPLEVFRAEAKERFGVDPMDISTVSVLVGIPGAIGPVGGAVVNTSEEVGIEMLLEELQADPDPIDVRGREAYLIPNPPGVVLHQADSKTIVVSTENWLEPLVTADNGTGQLATLAASIPRPKGVTLIVAIEPVRPLLSGLAQQQAQQLPPPLQPLARLPELVDALFVNLNSSVGGVGLRLSLLCTDDASAIEVEKILVNAIAFGKELGITQAKQAAADSPQSEAVRAATMKYIDRLATKLGTTFTPIRSGRRVNFSIQGNSGIATSGVMAGLLLPAVQAAREASRRMTAGNNLKQIGLAMYNYHASYNRFPPAAILDDNGNPLLSWRVAILPFVEQQALYEQFHLDEPWDSPHNKPLSEMMPSVYVDPSAPLNPGYTVFHAAVGDEFAIAKNGESRLRDMTDGTSYTILVMEVNRDDAVIWSKPEDVAVDLTNPLAEMGNTHPGGFHVLMADGAVKFIAKTINSATLRSLFTKAGGEEVAMP
jgi:prepilin-type processing-associated H-X9-DG protein